ncbi:MAG: hypothetical protein GSR77_00280 [Desulfurococcales archaeon]|nr:hypothetical protein [Desulfurococcales archaeon]
MAEDQYSNVEYPVNTLLTGLQSVNKERWCIERSRETRTVGFRVARLAKTIYDEILTDFDKELIKYMVEGSIYSLAKQHLEHLPCEEIISKRLTAIANIITGHGTIVFNININSNVAEAKSKASVRVDLEPIVRLVERLYELRKPLPPTQRKLVEELYHAVRKLN